MSRRTSIAAASSLSLLLCASLAVAGDQAFAGAGGQCPERAQATTANEQTPVVDEAVKPAPVRVEGGGGDAAAKPVRNRPRWQTYLPGMIR